MSFLLYDVTFLVIAGLLGGLFLLKRKKNLKRELGIFVLYRSQLGIKLINHISKKYKKTLLSFKYIIIAVGYLLMITILYYLGSAVYRYIRYPILTEIVKAPPLAPVLPYFPMIFGMESFFPDFYFTYFIIAFMVVATVHEFAHGIFMGYNKIRIKSTGVAFLGPLPIVAFVEQNDKDMEKAKKTDQMSILGAGVCANVIFAIIFLLIWWGIFSWNFTPTGAVFSSYSWGIVNASSISIVGGIPFANPTNQEIIKTINANELTIERSLDEDGKMINLTKIVAGGKNYYIDKERLLNQLKTNEDYLALYGDFPAINAVVKGTIIEIDGEGIQTYSDLSEVMKNKKPGEEINVKTRHREDNFEYELILDENPVQKGKGIIGISFDAGSLRTDDVLANYFFREANTEYEPKSEFLSFLYYLIFWVFGLNAIVALMNMLPFFIFDGGRFFYLTILGITKKEKVAKVAYKWTGILILSSLLLLMLIWFIRVI